MTRGDRDRWDLRWSELTRQPVPPPAPWLVEHAALLPPGRVLDVACGRGRNARFLAERGHQVVAADLAVTALRELRLTEPGITVVQMDFDAPGIREEVFDAIVCVNFLDRALFSRFARWLRPGGVLLLDTFEIRQREIGHPRDPHHLLGQGELRQLVAEWQILRYREGETRERGQRAFRAGVIAERTS